jgi:shikimate dehydrogenase
MKITASTPLFAVLGYPIQQSLSPILQNGWLDEFGYRGVYVALPVDPRHFEVALDGLFVAGLQGGNITAPFKERAAAHLKSLTPQAQTIGSVNCLNLIPGGFSGNSTDGEGFITDLDHRAPDWRNRHDHIVVLGAGGAARALIYALHKAGRRDIQLVNRNVERARATAAIIDDGSVIVRKWDEMDESFEGAGLVINATSAGLNGGNPLAPDFVRTRPDCLIYDSVYAPNGTAFLRAAADCGRTHLGGLGMLVGQGALAFESWFGIKPDFNSGLKRLEREIGA